LHLHCLSTITLFLKKTQLFATPNLLDKTINQEIYSQIDEHNPGDYKEGNSFL